MTAALNPARERLFATLPEVGEDAPLKYVLNFGKFCGTRVYDLPFAYLKWFVHEFQPHSRQMYLFAAAVHEYCRRVPDGDLAHSVARAKAWKKEVA